MKIFKISAYSNILLAATFLAPISADATTLLPHWVYSDNFKQNAAHKINRLTPTQHMARAEKRLKQGLHKQALKDLSIIKDNTNHKEFVNYATAVILTQQGHFKKSLGIVQDLLATGSIEYRDKIEDLEAALLVILSQENLAKDDIKKASYYLKYFVSKYKRTPYNNTALMLIQTINRKFKPPVKSISPLKIALLLPTSGEYAEIGQHLLRSAQLALFDSNNKNMLLYPLDTKGSPEGAQLAIKKAIEQGVDITIGPLLSSSVDAVTPFATGDMIMFPFSSNIKVASNKVFLNSFNPQEQARTIAKKAVDLRRKSFAALIPNTPYGQMVFQTFQNEIRSLTGKEIKYAFYDPEKIDISPQLDMITNMEETTNIYNKEIKALEKEFKAIGSAMDDDKLARLEEMRKSKPQPVIDFDALFIPSNGEDLPLIASQLAFFDIDAKDVLLLGTSTWNNQDVLKNRGEYLKNSIFPALPEEGIHDFEKTYFNSYGKTPHPFSTFAYDSIQLLSDFHHLHGNQVNKLPSYLSTEFGFNGLNGAFRFNQQGIPERQYAFKSIGRNKLKTVTPAAKVMTPYLPVNIQNKAKSFFNFNPWQQ